MKKFVLVSVLSLAFLSFAFPAYADSADVNKVEAFIRGVIQVLVTLAGLVSVVFFIIGGFKYITCSGNPETLEQGKRTIFYSALGLAVTLAAFVLSNIVTQIATAAFGK
jgi:TRAP-type C4-dicarboxylate transport system permease small subunit